jgi:triacylglycerol lipase
MLTLARLLLYAFTLVSASPLTSRATPDFAIDGDAPFSVDQAILAASLVCPNGIPSTKSPPVLLVHGTGSSGPETWADGYVPALLANGYTACYVTLRQSTSPHDELWARLTQTAGRAMGDMQVSSEYVAYNIHNLAAMSGGLPVAIISHSQGGPVTQWALQFWPSTRALTLAFIPLSPDFTGIEILDSALAGLSNAIDWQASIWQQTAGSQYYAALHAGDFHALVPTTAIYTKVCGHFLAM